MEFLVERWDRCGQVTESVMNGLLLVTVFLLLVAYCDGTYISPAHGGMWLYLQLGQECHFNVNLLFSDSVFYFFGMHLMMIYQYLNM
jgi:hypothetical protein